MKKELCISKWHGRLLFVPCSKSSSRFSDITLDGCGSAAQHKQRASISTQASMLNVQINKDLVLENDGDFGEDASMAPVCQIAMETPIPLQLFNCLPYIFLLKTFFFN